MMIPQLAFQPRATSANPPDNVAQATVTTSAQVVTLPVNLNGSMRLVNSGTASVAWAYGNVSGLTVATGVLMLPNTAEVFALPASVTQLTVIGSAAGSTLSICVGDGGI